MFNSSLKRKFVFFLFLWLTILFIVFCPTFNLQIYSSNSQIVASKPQLNNGFVGSSYISYNIVSVQATNNTGGLVDAFNVTVNSISFASIFLLILPIVWFILDVSDNLKFNLKVVVNKKMENES